MNLEDILFNIVFFLSTFFIIFLLNYYLLCKDRKGKKKIDKVTSIDMYLITRFKLNEKLINLKMMNFHTSIINSFIIAFVSTTVNILDVHIAIKLSISFVLLFALIYAIYEIYGRHLKKKESKL